MTEKRIKVVLTPVYSEWSAERCERELTFSMMMRAELLLLGINF
jgi:hypothetical protein